MAFLNNRDRFSVGVSVNHIPIPIGAMIMMMTIAGLVNKGV